MSSDQHDLLRIYVRDHHSASAAGAALSRRCANNNVGTEFEQALADLATAIAEDQHWLEEVMDWLVVSPSRFRMTVARLGEFVSRLKLNARLFEYSPLSRVVELETLTAGVSAKRQLWRSLGAVAAHDSTFADALAKVEFAQLEQRASEQLETIFALHRRAADFAFVNPSEQSQGRARPGRSAATSANP
jgi:hypothetical protein